MKTKLLLAALLLTVSPAFAQSAQPTLPMPPEIVKLVAQLEREAEYYVVLGDLFATTPEAKGEFRGLSKASYAAAAALRKLYLPVSIVAPTQPVSGNEKTPGPVVSRGR